MTGRIDRTNAARALAKAMAYADCNKPDMAARWAIALLHELQCTGIVKPETLKAYYNNNGL